MGRHEDAPIPPRAEQRVLNRCRAFSYVHLLGNYEDFIPVHLEEMGGLARFGDEEVKHQQLFGRAEAVLEDSCGHPFGRYFDEQKRRELTAAILEHRVLPRFLMLLALEWGTQRHYAESVRERTEPLYADILRAHWVEEAQHTKWGTLAIARLAEESSPGEISAAFDDVRAIGALIDATFAGQADAEIETLEGVTGRRFSAAERGVLRDALHRSLSAIVAGVSLTHASFTRIALELSTEGAAKLGIAA